MSRGLNKVHIIGLLGGDPEVKSMPNGKAVSNISVATTESWKDNQGQLHEETEWHKITLYGRQAEIAGQYLTKGSQVYIEGKLKTRKWQDQQGQDRYTTEIIAERMDMLGSNNQATQKPTPAESSKPSHSHNYQRPPPRSAGHAPARSGEPDLPEPQF